ncbi:MAG: LPS export ABC transporter periplasmic protein LptC [Thermoanaerobaculia bacterium]
MSGSVKYRPVVLIRRGLLAALALFLGVVVAIFINNRMRGDSLGAGAGQAAGTNSQLADVILSGKGFDYEVTDGDQRLFHIRADRILTNRDNVVSLEGVVLTVERSPGEVYELAAATGRYHSETNTADVEGEVVLRGPDDVELRGAKFSLLRKGTVVKSRSPVEFSIGGRLTGSANELEAYLKKDRFQLDGEVRLFGHSNDGEETLRLSANLVLYEKQYEQVHAEGGVVLDRGRDRLTCDRLAVSLNESSRPTFVRARWGVNGRMISSDSRGLERLLEFSGEELSLAYDDAGSEPRLFEIAGNTGNPARFDQGDGAGLVRRFVTDRIEARLRGGALRDARTDGAVIIMEFLRFDAGRELGRVCGDAAMAKFGPTGDLLQLTMDGDVELHRPFLQTRGDRLVTLGEDLIEVRGEPAVIYTKAGEMSAPELAYRTSVGQLTAVEGVRAWFPPGGDFTMLKTGEAERDAPIQVTSETAKWTEAEGLFSFDGAVRAWQGESFLTAGRLLGKEGGKLRAEGGIKTVLERTPSDGEPEDESGPVEVTAESLDYSKNENLIEYRGGPEVRDAGRFMSCEALDVVLGEASSLASLRCSGNALVDDRVGGNKVRGSEAVYRPDDSKVEVSGSPAVLEDPDGAVIKAGRMIYDLETATAQFLSGSSSVAQETPADPEATDG